MACQPLPAVSFSDECAPDTLASEIEEIFVANADADDLTDVEDPVEWATLLSQTVVTTGNEIRRLTVIGDKPAATPITVALSKRRNKVIDASHVLNFEIDDVSTQNYAAVLAWQTGVRLKVWYKTRGGMLYGGNTGVIADVVVNPVLGRGEEIEKIIGTFSWKNISDPSRVVSPI